MSVVLGTGAGVSPSRAVLCTSGRGRRGSRLHRATTQVPQNRPPLLISLFSCSFPHLIHFNELPAQDRIPPSQPAGPWQQPLPSFVLILIRKNVSKQSSHEGNTDAGSGSHSSASTAHPEREMGHLMI